MHKPIDNIVFSGGGVLGCAYVGALQALDTILQPLPSVKRFMGTSVGSILATLAALRYTPAEIEEIMVDLDFKKLADQGIYTLDFDSFSIQGIYEDIKDICKLIHNERGNFGLNSGSYLETWAENMIQKKLGKNHATFSDLHKNQSLGELYITGSNFSLHQSEVYSFETTPDMVISKAIRISTAVPILFDVVKENNHIKVDGGLYNNFPMSIVVPEQMQYTLGLDFDHTPIHQLAKVHQITADNMTSFGWEKYVVAMLSATFVAQSVTIPADIEQQIVCIDSLKINGLDFRITSEEKKRLFGSGYQSVVGYTRPIA